MKIFADRHHEALYQSLIYLFEKRLGHELYHPQDISWFDSGNWKIADCYGLTARNTALQFLESATPTDGTETLIPYRGITYEEFIHTEFDLVIATHIDHILLYRELINKFQPKAKLIAQIGNSWILSQEQVNAVDGVMASVQPFPFTEKPIIFYHQEFKQPEYKPPAYNMVIRSFVNALNINTLFKADWIEFLYLEAVLNRYTFYSHGGGCRDGALAQHDVLPTMQQTMFAVHLKSGGDGYGHVIHSLMAMGVPVIYRGSQYRGKLAEPLLVHFSTGFDLDQISVKNLAKVLNEIDPELHQLMSSDARQKFLQTVDFEGEAKELSEFFYRLF